VAVVGHQVALLAGGGEQHLLGRAALVRGHEEGMPVIFWITAFQPVEAARAGVALVPFHDGAPLPAGHGAGAGIGQPVDQHVLGAQLEDVEVGGFEQLLALGAAGHADGFDALDAEGFDQGLGHDGLAVFLVRWAKLAPEKPSWCRSFPTVGKEIFGRQGVTLTSCIAHKRRH
jgi:hypothetical protein